MILTELRIHCLRNIPLLQIALEPRFNFVFGPNGSGKTSILEALYLLSCGHSFRTRETSSLISHGQSALTVFARSLHEETVSVQKSNGDGTQIKLNNQFCAATSQLAYALPCQIFYSNIFQIIDAGPAVRRSVLDWGLFHVKPNYLPLWKEYKRVLKQRNALLKQRAPYTHFIPWDKQLSDCAEELHLLRQDYFFQWKIAFAHVLKELCDLDCTIIYFKGWDKKNTEKTLAQTLMENFSGDTQKLYTQSGAHQADIIIEVNQNKAKHVLSRGQQKIILFALKLAQANLLNRHCLYLIDDLPSELDETHQKKIIMYLSQKKGQYIITSTQPLKYLEECMDEEVYLSHQLQEVNEAT